MEGGLFEGGQIFLFLEGADGGVQGGVGGVEFAAEEVFEAGVVFAV